MMVRPHSSGGRPSISSRSIVTRGCASQGGGDGSGEAVAVNGQRPAGRDLVGIGRAQDQRPERPHFLVQQADGVAVGIVRAERIRADELGEIPALMRLRAAHGPHLVENDRMAALGDLPGGSDPARPPPTIWMGEVSARSVMVTG